MLTRDENSITQYLLTWNDCHLHGQVCEGVQGGHLDSVLGYFVTVVDNVDFP